MTDLNTAIGPLRLKNPTMLASGIMDEDAGSIQRMIELGAGAIVTKSIGIHPRDGYANPTVIELEHGILNAMGLPNPGIDLYGKEMNVLKKTEVPIIGSIFAATAEDFVTLATKMQGLGAAAVELNVSCPHAKHYGLEVGSDLSLVYDIISSIKHHVHLPVFVKVSPNMTNLVEVAQTIENAKADAIVAINTVRGMKINLETGLPILANKTGGYSGKAIKPIGIRCVYDIAQTVHIPVIGVGGITNGEDAIEYFMAGACAIQVGSAVYYRGPEVFHHINKEIAQWMRKHNYKKLSEIIGAACR